MKKTFKLPLLVLICLLTSLFIGCSDDNGESIPVLEVESKSLSLVVGGETKYITIEANNQWKATVSDNAKDWLSVSQSAKELSITAKPNNTSGSRQGIITVTSAGLQEEIKVSQFGQNIEIIPETKTKTIAYSDESFELIISSNTDYTISVKDGDNWLREVEKPNPKSSGLTDKTHYFETDINYGESLRKTTITIKQKDGNVESVVTIEQKSYSSDDNPLDIEDIKLEVKDAWASSIDNRDNKPISLAFDGDYNTHWHSDWSTGTTSWPINAIFYLKDADYVDYILYYPRTDHTNGNFKKFKLYASYEATPDRDNPAHWEYIKDYDFEGSNSPSEIEFSPALANPTAFKFEISSGVGDNSNGFASCAEMEFYKKKTFDVDLSLYFADDICSAVKAGITEDQILKSELPHFFKNLALQLMAGDYSPYRIQEYEAYRPINDLGKELKTSTYNTYENPTGIWLEAGKQAYVFVPDTKGERISLTLRNWTSEKTETFALKAGINSIKPTVNGLTYINYFTTNYADAAPIKIHIAEGKINGYFDHSRDQAGDWTTILNNTVGDYFDFKGKYTNMCFHVASLKQHCPTDGKRLMDLYDEIIEMQYEQMGLFKYNRVPKNHMMGMNSSKDGVYMHAGSLGAVFHYNTMGDIGNPSQIITGDMSWGIAHEYGHVNQIRPGLKWVGTAECTNNIYSSYAQYMITSKYSTLALRLEHENCASIEGESNVIGGRFNSHLHYGVLKGDNWLFQWGQDGKSDHFVKLVPIWQLNLYFKVVTGTPWSKPDWYADICEDVRKDNASYTDGEHQINFMKKACEHTQTDLSDFFEKAGMLKPVNMEIDDYGIKKLIITEAMCEEVKSYASQWNKPAGVINYISGNTVKIYETRSDVQGNLNQGVSGSGITRTVNHNIWKNAVVYETYAGEELIRITMAGTGTKNNSSTTVPYPSNATKIVAVSWKGDRTTVYQP